MTSLESLFTEACRRIDDEAEALNTLSQSIWSTPELNFEEKHAHRVLCDFLEKRGFTVQRSYTGIETAFKATWQNTQKPSEDHSLKKPHIVVICEYDALPEIGHACGHNLIAQVGVAAGLGVKAAMEKYGTPFGKITVLGTPAEELGGGKIDLIDNGAFDDVDAALMVHPAPCNMLEPIQLAVNDFTVVYKGAATHAACAPWEGLNALDAVVMAYNGLSLLRQQLEPSVMIHGVITKGGVKPNIIPDHTEMEIYVRAPTLKVLKIARQKVDNCFKGAALSTGCDMSIRGEKKKPYLNMIHNKHLVELYSKHVKSLNPDWCENGDPSFLSSSDMGNVSLVVPSIQPYYTIGPEMNHTKEFTTASGSATAQPPTQEQGKVLAMIALEVMSDVTLMAKVKDDFTKATKS